MFTGFSLLLLVAGVLCFVAYGNGIEVSQKSSSDYQVSVARAESSGMPLDSARAMAIFSPVVCPNLRGGNSYHSSFDDRRRLASGAWVHKSGSWVHIRRLLT